MYGKGGYGVFNAELRPAEVDPRFKIFLNQISVSKRHSAHFRPIVLKLIERGLQYVESTFH